MGDGELEFQRIYDAYQPRILRYLARLVGEPEAEDLTQEVFVKVSQALETFRGEAQLSTWIYRIATNAAIDKMRTASFRQDAGHSSLDDSDETEDNWAGAGSLHGRDDFAKRVYRLVSCGLVPAPDGAKKESRFDK